MPRAGFGAVTGLQRHSGGSAVIGLDVGGTGIKAALWTPRGGIHARLRRATPHQEGTRAIIDAIFSSIDELVAQADEATPVRAVGLAVPGLVDEVAGVATWSENLRWRDVPLRGLVESRTALPVWLGHDVRAGGAAEFRNGAGAGARDAVFVPIGTGIGAALQLDGHSYSAHGFAGEIGHVDVGHAEPCRCGATGCLEAIASAGAISRRYSARTGKPDTGAAEVVARAHAGDSTAGAIWNDAIEALALALSWVASVLAPEIVIVGGGLSLAGRLLLEPLEERLNRRLTFQRRPRLDAAAYGDEAACVGAAILANDLIERRADSAGDGSS